MDDERKTPEYPPEYAPEITGMRWLSIAEVEGLIGKKERNARYWLERHEIPSRGERPKLFSEQAIIAKLDELGQPHRKVPETPPEYIPERPPESTGTYDEPIEAAYRVTPAEIEQAVSRTSAQYMGDLRTMLAEVGKVYEGQLAAKDETIAELRRRAEAEALRNEALVIEVSQLRARRDDQQEQIVAKYQALAVQEETIAQLRREAAAEAEARRLQDEVAYARQTVAEVPEGPPSARSWWARLFGKGDR